MTITIPEKRMSKTSTPPPLQLSFSVAAEVLLRDAVAKEAAAIAGSRLYSGTEAIREFGLTRSSLKYIAETLLPERTKPLYAATAITSFIEQRTSIRPKSKATTTTNTP